MIETREAIDNVEAIMDVEGLDGAFIGKFNKILFVLPISFSFSICKIKFTLPEKILPVQKS